MKIEIMQEIGFYPALLGLSLSYSKKFDEIKMHQVAKKLAKKGLGHNKFLEFIIVYLDITAPRYWWQQFDSYRIGVTKQSESTMHTLIREKLTQANFEKEIDLDYLFYLNSLRNKEDFDELKNALPEGFLQRRIVMTNYKTLYGIYLQRKNHKLKEWKYFCEKISKLQGWF